MEETRLIMKGVREESWRLESGTSIRHFNLYFTNGRLVAIHTVRGQKGAGLGAFSLVGEVASRVIDKRLEKEGKRMEEEMAGMSLDEMLEQDGESFAFPYSELAELKLKGGWGDRCMELREGFSGRKAKFILSVEEVATLKQFLPSSGIAPEKMSLPKS